MHVWNVLHAARWKKWRKNDAKNRHLGAIAQLCRAVSLHLSHVLTIGKKLVKPQYLLHRSPQYGELQPTSGWERLASLGRPSKSQRLSRLGFITTATITLGIGPHSSCTEFHMPFMLDFLDIVPEFFWSAEMTFEGYQQCHLLINHIITSCQRSTLLLLLFPIYSDILVKYCTFFYPHVFVTVVDGDFIRTALSSFGVRVLQYHEVITALWRI